MRSPFVLSLHLVVFVIGLVFFALAAARRIDPWPWRERLIAAGLFCIFLSQLIAI